jgi:chemotaxis protein CheX
MSKRPKVSLSSIVAETARRAEESGTDSNPLAAAGLADEGAPILDSGPRLVVSSPEPEALPVLTAAPIAVAGSFMPAEPDPAPIAAPSLAPAAALGPAPIADLSPAPLAAPSHARAEPIVAAPSAGAVVGLPPILDLKAASQLRDEFCAAKGGPLDVDASKVQRLGGLCLQVLLSAQRSWAVDGKPFRVVDPSPDFLEGIRCFGAAGLTEGAPIAL